MNSENDIAEAKPRRSRSRSPVRRSRSKSESPIRRRRPINIISTRVIVKNIPYDVKWQELKDLFRDNVGGVLYAELEVDPAGRSKGVGVVEFQTMDYARSAVEKMHRFKVKDRKLIVLEERESDRPPQMPGDGPMGGVSTNDMAMYEALLKQLDVEGPVSHTVFVTNLDFSVDNRKLREVFCLAGNVLRSEVITDNNGRSRGNALIQFESPLGAIQAIAMFNGQELFTRTMRVKMDKESALGSQMPLAAGPRLPAGLKSIGQTLQSLGYVGNMPASGGARGGDMGPGMRGGLGGGVGGGMGGMGPGASRLDLNTLASLTNLGGGIGGLGAGLGGAAGLGSGLGAGLGGGLAGGMGSGIAGLSGNLLGGMGGVGNIGNLAENQAALNNLLSMANAESMGNAGRMGNFGGRGDGFGLDGDRRGGGGVGNRGMRNEESTIVAKNLPYTLSWQDLKERFKENGFDVRYVEMKLENNRSTGTAVIRFSSPEEAHTVIEKMNRTQINGREMVLKMV